MPVGTAITMDEKAKKACVFAADSRHKHMMGPYGEADHANGYQGIHHAEISEDGFLGEGRDDLTDHSEAAEDHDVHLGMAEEPKQVLIENWVAAMGGVEERGAEISVGQQHGEGACQHR